jgi:putative transposase
MSRPPRPQIPNGLYHVTVRGVRRTTLFHESADCRALLQMLGAVVKRYVWECYGYCLMPNHFHLLVRTVEPTISLGMQYLNSRFAQWFNHKYGFEGHALERRFRAVVIEREEHLLELARYLALNPVRAGLCARPEDWPWSSYTATAGRGRAPAFLDVDWLQEQFADASANGAARFADFVAAALLS